VFTARYALIPYIKQTRFVCKGLIIGLGRLNLISHINSRNRRHVSSSLKYLVNIIFVPDSYRKLFCVSFQSVPELQSYWILNSVYEYLYIFFSICLSSQAIIIKMLLRKNKSKIYCIVWNKGKGTGIDERRAGGQTKSKKGAILHWNSTGCFISCNILEYLKHGPHFVKGVQPTKHRFYKRSKTVAPFYTWQML
jgi:hypothetical protein